MKRYHHFTIEERGKIQELLWQKSSIRTIAGAIGRSPASVSREIKRNLPPLRRQYTPRLAHERALTHRKHRRRGERLKSADVRDHVVSHLKLGWSPEQIAATSDEALYERVRDGVQSEDKDASERYLKFLRAILRASDAL